MGDPPLFPPKLLIIRVLMYGRRRAPTCRHCINYGRRCYLHGSSARPSLAASRGFIRPRRSFAVGTSPSRLYQRGLIGTRSSFARRFL